MGNEIRGYRFFSDRRDWWIAVGLTILLEALTLLLRFGMGLESTRDTATTIGVWTLGLRIHHGYIGMMLWMFYLAIGDHHATTPHRTVLLQKVAKVAAISGFALFASDLIHHFLVLWPIVGSPQFDLFY